MQPNAPQEFKCYSNDSITESTEDMALALLSCLSPRVKVISLEDALIVRRVIETARVQDLPEHYRFTYDPESGEFDLRISFPEFRPYTLRLCGIIEGWTPAISINVVREALSASEDAAHELNRALRRLKACTSAYRMATETRAQAMNATETALKDLADLAKEIDPSNPRHWVAGVPKEAKIIGLAVMMRPKKGGQK